MAQSKALLGQGKYPLDANVSRSAAQILAARVLSLGLSFGVSLLLARLLSMEDYGALTYIAACMALLAIPAGLGLDRLVIRETASYLETGNWSLLQGLVRWARKTVLVASLVTAAGAGLVAYALFVAGRLNQDHLFYFLLSLAALPLGGMNMLRQALAAGLHYTVRSNVLDLIVQPVSYLSLVLLAYVYFGQRFGPYQVVGAGLGAALLTLVCGMLLLRGVYPGQARAATPTTDRRSWVAGAGGFLLLSGMNVAGNYADTLLLGLLLDSEAVGRYVPATRGANLVTYVLFAFNSAMAPAISACHMRGDMAGLQRLMTKNARIMFLCALPLLVVLGLFGDWFLALYGPGFLQARTALTVLTLGQLVNVATGSVGLLLNMCGHNRLAVAGNALGFSLSLGLYLMLIPQWGLEGAAIATAAGVVTRNVLLVVWAHRRLGINSTAFALGASS